MYDSLCIMAISARYHFTKTLVTVRSRIANGESAPPPTRGWPGWSVGGGRGGARVWERGCRRWLVCGCGAQLLARPL